LVSWPRSELITVSERTIIDHIQIEHVFARDLAWSFFATWIRFSRSVRIASHRGSFTTVSDVIPEIEARNRDEFRKWLEENHKKQDAVWLILWKKGSGRPSIAWSDAVDVALCFGWVDSKVQAIDAERYRQYWTVRKPGSTWSKINKEKIARLTAAGLMTPAGLAAVERAKQNGSWTILDGPEAGIVPEDLSTAMAEAGVHATFDQLTPGGRKAILAWLVMAKREATRAGRIKKTIEALERGESPL
jgi:uncharacterized protein YdeI (YjbR/CyaY-like superfamily)